MENIKKSIIAIAVLPLIMIACKRIEEGGTKDISSLPPQEQQEILTARDTTLQEVAPTIDEIQLSTQDITTLETLSNEEPEELGRILSRYIPAEKLQKIKEKIDSLQKGMEKANWIFNWIFNKVRDDIGKCVKDGKVSGVCESSQKEGQYSLYCTNVVISPCSTEVETISGKINELSLYLNTMVPVSGRSYIYVDELTIGNMKFKGKLGATFETSGNNSGFNKFNFSASTTDFTVYEGSTSFTVTGDRSQHCWAKDVISWDKIGSGGIDELCSKNWERSLKVNVDVNGKTIVLSGGERFVKEKGEDKKSVEKGGYVELVFNEGTTPVKIYISDLKLISKGKEEGGKKTFSLNITQVVKVQDVVVAQRTKTLNIEKSDSVKVVNGELKIIKGEKSLDVLVQNLKFESGCTQPTDGIINVEIKGDKNIKVVVKFSPKTCNSCVVNVEVTKDSTTVKADGNICKAKMKAEKEEKKMMCEKTKMSCPEVEHESENESENMSKHM